jgi:hypothetical protein
MKYKVDFFSGPKKKVMNGVDVEENCENESTKAETLRLN